MSDIPLRHNNLQSHTQGFKGPVLASSHCLLDPHLSKDALYGDLEVMCVYKYKVNYTEKLICFLVLECSWIALLIHPHMYFVSCKPLLVQVPFYCI